MTLSEYYKLVEKQREKNLQWRLGQTLFNVLSDIRPDLSEKIRGNDLDPFYNDAKIEKFNKFLEENWSC